jgi:hypothetical protein
MPKIGCGFLGLVNVPPKYTRTLLWGFYAPYEAKIIMNLNIWTLRSKWSLALHFEYIPHLWPFCIVWGKGYHEPKHRKITSIIRRALTPTA